MRPLNIYTLTRVEDDNSISMLERQLSSRDRFLSIKDWEVVGLKSLADKLASVMGGIGSLEFYYSFVIPKIGKEFDLLMISDKSIVNIELKSGSVTDETIRNQLELNRYYLASLERTMHLYTYISGEDRLVRLTKGGNLIEANWEELAKVIAAASEKLYSGNIEVLFNEANFMVSPMSEPERFLRNDYLLTSQQKDIRKHILRDIAKADGAEVREGFTGLPGTGKTMLLYNLAMELSEKEHVIVLHFGSFPPELAYLNGLLRRVHIFDCREHGPVCEAILEAFKEHNITCMFIDEGHHMEKSLLDEYVGIASESGIPVIFSYDSEEVICPAERAGSAIEEIKALPGFVEYRLTNRIRTNKEVSTFIYALMKLEGYHSSKVYPSVEVAFASNGDDAALVLDKYLKAGYSYIQGELDQELGIPAEVLAGGKVVNAEDATCGEADAVVMFMNEHFYYDAEGYLRADASSHVSPVRELFHGLNRARNRVAVIVYNNREILDTILRILQGKKED